MFFDHLHISALATVVREGSFEQAAAALCVTPSAISQRIRALEEKAGAILIIRDNPCRPTAEGEKLYRHAVQMELLERDVLDEMKLTWSASFKPIPVAVNTDTLATWFPETIGMFAKETGHCVEVFADDQDHTAQWLKEGRVLGAVTTLSKAVQGCRSEKLGLMRYLALAAPSFVKQHFAGGVDAESLAKAPMLAFNRKDNLNDQFIKIFTKLRVQPPCHWIPSSQIFQDGAAMGLGWSLVPDFIAQAYLKNKTLVEIAPGHEVTMTLHWQCWRLSSGTLDALTRAVRKSAKASLS